MRIKEVDVGVVAIFDGHNGAEASEMASKLFLDYFLLHVYFLLDGLYSMLFRKSTGKLTYREVAIFNNVFNLYKDVQSNHREEYVFLCRRFFFIYSMIFWIIQAWFQGNRTCSLMITCRSCWTSPAILDRSFHMEILKESLTRAVHDIDLTFFKEGLMFHLHSSIL